MFGFLFHVTKFEAKTNLALEVDTIHFICSFLRGFHSNNSWARLSKFSLNAKPKNKKGKHSTRKKQHFHVYSRRQLMLTLFPRASLCWIELGTSLSHRNRSKLGYSLAAFFTFWIPILHQMFSILTIHLFGILWFDCQPNACTIIWLLCNVIIRLIFQGMVVTWPGFRTTG